MKKYRFFGFLLLILPILTLAQDLSNTTISNEESLVSNTNIMDISNANTNFLDAFYTEDTNTAPTPTLVESPAMTLLRIMLITGILGFLTWIAIRFFFRRNALSLTIAGKSIEVLATVPAGLGSYFIIAKLGNLYYLCSLSTDGLRLLDKITDQEAIDFIELNKEQTIPQEMKFIDLIDQLPEGKTKDALEFLKEKIQQLRNK